MARKKLLIAAVVVGLFAASLVYLFAEQERQKRDELQADPEQVVVAATDIRAGRALSEDNITTQMVPARFLPANPLEAEDVNIYLGQPVSQDIEAGSMILTSDFAVAEVARTLSARVPSEERAMTVPVDAVSGVGGLLQPGDRVDILGTFPVGQRDELIPEASGGESIGYVTMSLLQNVTLLAVGQRIADVGQGGQARSGGGYSNVTMAMTPDEAELMVIAQTRGELTLLLRNREDLDTVPVTRRTLREVLEELDVINRERKERVVRSPPPCPPGQSRQSDGSCQRDLEIID